MKNKLNPTVIATAIALALTATAAQSAKKLPEAPTYSDKIFGSRSLQEAKYDIINDASFYRPHAYLAHFMGFAWAGGTASQYVGGDMKVQRVNSHTYSVKAEYDRNDPYASGYRANKRLAMTFKNIRFVSDIADLKLGRTETYDTEQVSTATAYAYNCSAISTDQVPVTSWYNKSESWTKSDEKTLSLDVSLTNKWEVGIPGLGGAESEVSVTVGGSKSWGNSRGEATDVRTSTSYNAYIQPESKRVIRLNVLKSKSETPYELYSYMKYNLEFYNFLRYSGNADYDHPTNRPYKTASFGAKDGVSHGVDMRDDYKYSYIGGYSDWDWHWMVDEYGQSNVDYAIANTTRRYGSVLRGLFSTESTIDVYLAGGGDYPLTADDRERWCGNDDGSGYETLESKNGQKQARRRTSGVEMIAINGAKVMRDSNGIQKQSNNKYNIVIESGLMMDDGKELKSR